jgi:RNA polymerase sigma-70 factor (ECF subfamily)
LISSKNKILIAGIQRGDSQVFEELFHEFYSALCDYSKLIVNRSDVAEDIVQELFFKIWNKKENLNISTSLKAYLYRSVYNNAIEYLRTEKLEKMYKEYNFREIHSEGNLQSDSDQLALVNKAIEELPDKCKDVFKLRKFEKLSHAEIAQKLDISVKTVETHIHRATVTLKDKLKNLYIIELIYILMNIL